jgi:hypothetical protein
LKYYVSYHIQHTKTKMATSTFTTQSKQLNVFSADSNQYLQIVQDGTATNEWHFAVKNSVDNTANTSIKPCFPTLTFKENGSTVNITTRLSGLDTSISGISTNAAGLTTANANIAQNATDIATNATAISTETGARQAADTSLQSQIDAANTSVAATIATIQSDHTTEVNARIAADNALLQASIDLETTNRGTAIGVVQTQVDAHETSITSLQTNMNNVLNLSTAELDSFAEVATELNNIGVATINTRLSDLEAAVAALQGS